MNLTIIASPTERSTAATDALIGVVALGYAAKLLGYRQQAPWRAGVWAGTFGALSFSGFLGAVVHGFEMPETRRTLLWKPLNLTLGLTVALFATGALGDLAGERVARRATPGLLASALGFFFLSQRLQRGFLIFILYEALAMLFALGAYVRLAQAGQLDGAQQMAAGVLISIIAAAIQSSNLQLTIFGIPLDNNGLFHIVQLAGLPLLAAGLRADLDA
ncbi:hypothetical protein OSCT_2102 [Oscillochloris trichoides DG-6]|uniref:Uncharacterized protein n=1 Tax=Oscillochloris trichoides DG-6 TaxID=765420 RepID=E1IFK1_9CHLR|nr:hypothetical protein [Oscillochloris trichoides]EFO80017.1 hypothetical protein OSCT_2102 [Oscillochloris trichoides DG-6]